MTVHKVLIYAEGPTEERFIKDIMAPHLTALGVYVVPVIATTKVVKSGPNFKGGIGTYAKTKRELQRLLGDNSATVVTTMIDYYGLPRSFPGRSAPQGTTCYDLVTYVEQALFNDLNNRKFMPFLTLHEFEGLLFASPRDMADALPDGGQLCSNFSAIRNRFGTPEEIDDDPATAPHKCIEDLYPNYQKPLHGTLIANKIGLNSIRSDCSHFDEWFSKLELLGQGN